LPGKLQNFTAQTLFHPYATGIFWLDGCINNKTNNKAFFKLFNSAQKASPAFFLFVAFLIKTPYQARDFQ